MYVSTTRALRNSRSDTQVPLATKDLATDAKWASTRGQEEVLSLSPYFYYLLRTVQPVHSVLINDTLLRCKHVVALQAHTKPVHAEMNQY